MTDALSRFETLRADPVARAAYLRDKSIGGSQVGQLLGLSSWGTPADLFDAIYGLARVEPPSTPMRRGTLLEPFIADEVARAYGPLSVAPPRCPHPTIPHFHGSVDRFANNAHNEVGIVEIKCLGYASRQRFREQGGVDPNYVAQVQAYYAIYPGAVWAALIAFDAGEWEYVAYPIHRHQPTIDAIEAEVQRFWADHVAPGVRPLTWPAPFRQLPIVADKAKPVTMTDTAWHEALERLHVCRDRFDDAEAEKAWAERVVKDMMGAHVAIEVPGVGKVSWKEQARTTIDTAAIFAAHPSLVESEYARTTISRVFRPTFAKEATP